MGMSTEGCLQKQRIKPPKRELRNTFVKGSCQGNGDKAWRSLTKKKKISFLILKMGEIQYVKIGLNFSLSHLPLKASE